MIVARNEYGETLRLPGKHPRKELLAALDRRHADRIYIDRRDGSTAHIGYIVARRWWTLYAPIEKPVR
jgi:hypothetical protein